MSTESEETLNLVSGCLRLWQFSAPELARAAGVSLKSVRAFIKAEMNAREPRLVDLGVIVSGIVRRQRARYYQITEAGKSAATERLRGRIVPRPSYMDDRPLGLMILEGTLEELAEALGDEERCKYLMRRAESALCGAEAELRDAKECGCDVGDTEVRLRQAALRLARLQAGRDG